MDATNASLEDLVAKLFIARPDVKAEQQPTGEYYTHATYDASDYQRDNPHYIPWSRQALSSHLAGSSVFGHYLLNTDNKCKLFAFDIDLDTTGSLPTDDMRMVDSDDGAARWVNSFKMQNPREVWKDRAHAARPFIKTLFMQAAIKLTREIEKLGLPTLTAYSGNKGIHVYGFTGLMEAKLVREAARLVLDSLECPAVKGDVFFKFKQSLDDDLHDILTIELFPKQDELDADRFGNLMRLPLGKNRKSQDPTFLIDIEHVNQMMPVQDPRAALAGVLTQLQAAQLA